MSVSLRIVLPQGADAGQGRFTSVPGAPIHWSQSGGSEDPVWVLSVTVAIHRT